MNKHFRHIYFAFLLLPLTAKASFIESTIGAAVVNDATAAYYNPAALTLLKSTQIVGLSTYGYFHSEFSGQATQIQTNFTLSGTSNINTHYFLPSGYIGVPATDKIFLGVAVVGNTIGKDLEQNSILRYAQTDNNVKDIDIVPAIGIKLNDKFSLGAGLNFSHADFQLNATTGFPSLNIPDSQSRNQASGTAFGGDVGVLWKPTASTLIGLNYRSLMTYHLHGKSVLEGDPGITSDNYSFTFWTPARYVFSINQQLRPTLGLIGTIQWIQWDPFNKIHIHNIATQIGRRAVIIPEATVPFHLHNSWAFTVGGHYHMTKKWVIRAAGSYVESPSNGHFQISNGDNIVLGASTAYEFNKHITIDCSYAHTFIQKQNINITNQLNIINGKTHGFRDGVSLKLTFNM